MSECVSLYLVSRRDSADAYVGITSNDVRQRWHAHKCDARKGRGTRFARSLAKHGPDAFEWRVLAMLPSRAAAESAERAVIAALSPTLNLTAGGEGVNGLKHSDASRAKMRGSRPGLAEKMRARAATPEGRAHLSSLGAKTAELRKAAGLPPIRMTPEVRAKMSASAKARCTPEWRADSARKRRGRKASPETRAKLSAARTKYPPGTECIECEGTTKPIQGGGKCETCYQRAHARLRRARKAAK